jgi:putative sigma-54 modulation protein
MIMEVHTTARRVKVTPAVRRLLDERLAKLTRYVPELREAHVKLAAEKYRHQAEILIRVRHEDVIAKEEAADLLSAVDGAADRLEMQLRRLKEKKSRRVVARRVADGGVRRSAAAAALGVEPRPARSRPGRPASPAAAERRPRVLRSGAETKPLSVDEAVDRLLAEELPFLVFVDSRSERPCVLHRRPDGNLVLVEGRR